MVSNGNGISQNVVQMLLFSVKMLLCFCILYSKI